MMRFKKWFRWFWICFVLAGLSFYFISPDSFTSDSLAAFMSQHEGMAILFYLFISCIRGVFLFPSTPFVLAGVLLFPNQPLLVVGISMIGIMFTSFLLYAFAENLGFRDYLVEKHPRKMKIWEQRLSKPFSFWIVLAWSFFPFVPTDLICYVAGTVKMKKIYYYSGVFIGELILVLLYVYLGKDLWQVFTV